MSSITETGVGVGISMVSLAFPKPVHRSRRAGWDWLPYWYLTDVKWYGGSSIVILFFHFVNRYCKCEFQSRWVIWFVYWWCYLCRYLECLVTDSAVSEVHSEEFHLHDALVGRRDNGGLRKRWGVISTLIRFYMVYKVVFSVRKWFSSLQLIFQSKCMSRKVLSTIWHLTEVVILPYLSTSF